MITFTKQEPSSTIFTGDDAGVTWSLKIETMGNGKRATLAKDGVQQGQYIDFPNTAFIKDLFEQVSAAL